VLVVGVRIQRSSHNAFEFSVQGTYTGKCLFPLELEENARPRLFHGARVPAHYDRSLERPVAVGGATALRVRACLSQLAWSP
jgi:hypothetical protein